MSRYFPRCLAFTNRHVGSLSNRDPRAQNAIQAHCQPAQKDRTGLPTPLPPALLRQQKPTPLPSPHAPIRPILSSTSSAAIESRDSSKATAILLPTSQSPRDNGLQSQRSLISKPQQTHPPKACPYHDNHTPTSKPQRQQQ